MRPFLRRSPSRPRTLDGSHGFPFNLRPFIKPGEIARAINGVNETVVSLDDVERPAALPGIPHCVAVHVPGNLQGRPLLPLRRLNEYCFSHTWVRCFRREMLDFGAQHGIAADVELIPIQKSMRPTSERCIMM